MSTARRLADDVARDLVLRHLGGRAVPPDVAARVEWAAAQRLADDLHPALDRHLTRVLDAAAAARATGPAQRAE
jgi:hypothetical protein